MQNIDEILQKYVILDHVPLGVFIIASDYSIIFWNRCMEDWTQLNKTDVLSKKIQEFFPAFNDSKYTSRIESIFSGGPPIILSSQLHGHIFRLPTKTNLKPRIHHTTITSIPAIEPNNFYALISVEDVTELTERIQDYKIMRDKTLEEIKQRQLAEKILQESEEKFRLLYLNLPGGSFTINENYIIEDVNDLMCELTGYSKHELIGNPCSLVCNYSKDYCPLFTLRENYVDNQETIIKTKDGDLIPVIKSARKLKVNNKTVVVESFQDITVQKQAQELRKSLEIAERTAQIKQQFLANMSHEMRTPMNGILGMLDFLKKTKLDEDQKDYVQTIESSATSLLVLINDILEISKIEAGKIEIRPQIFNIYNLIHYLIKLFDAPLKQKMLEFNSYYDNAIPVFIKADKNRVLQIASNLISNAIKFTPKGKIEIYFSLVNKTPSGELTIKIEVIDSGIGISKEDQPKLFKVFTQIDSSYSRNSDGSGLGLVISKELAALLGGEIGVISEKGIGSNFWFTFKAIEITDNQISEQNENTQKYENLNLNINVLLAEDKFVNQKVVSMMLENVGCKVDIAQNGQEVLEKFKEDYYQIILMDIQMPIMDGVTAMKILRKSYNNLPPIIAVSANAMEGDAEHYIKDGMDDYLAKPITRESLYEKIIKWLKT